MYIHFVRIPVRFLVEKGKCHKDEALLSCLGHLRAFSAYSLIQPPVGGKCDLNSYISYIGTEYLFSA
jgi:hypothetical protein